MITTIPSAKLKSNLKHRLDAASLSKMHSMAWLNYQLFLKQFAKLAADKARADKSVVIRESHVRDVAKEVLNGIKG